MAKYFWNTESGYGGDPIAKELGSGYVVRARMDYPQPSECLNHEVLIVVDSEGVYLATVKTVENVSDGWLEVKIID